MVISVWGSVGPSFAWRSRSASSPSAMASASRPAARYATARLLKLSTVSPSSAPSDSLPLRPGCCQHGLLEEVEHRLPFRRRLCRAGSLRPRLLLLCQCAPALLDRFIAPSVGVLPCLKFPAVGGAEDDECIREPDQGR